MNINNDISGVLYVDAEKGEDIILKSTSVVTTAFDSELGNSLEGGLKVTKKLVSQAYYQVKCPYVMDATRIVIHNTYNDAPAINEINYMLNTTTTEVSFHFAVDDTQVVQGLPLNRNGWHAGDGGNGIGNRQGIGIEICYSRSGGTKFIESEKNAAKLVAHLLNKAGWGVDKITKHQDYSGKYCPHRTLDMGWQRFITMCQEELNKLLPAKEPYPIGTVVYNTEDLTLESTIYEDGTRQLLPKNSLSKVYKYMTKDSVLWMALTDGKGVVRPAAWTKQLDKFTVNAEIADDRDQQILDLKKKVEELEAQIKEKDAKIAQLMKELEELAGTHEYPVGTVVYNTVDLTLESTIYGNGEKSVLPKNSKSKVYKYITKDSELWLALADEKGVVRSPAAWTKQLDKVVTRI